MSGHRMAVMTKHMRARKTGEDFLHRGLRERPGAMGCSGLASALSSLSCSAGTSRL